MASSLNPTRVLLCFAVKEEAAFARRLSPHLVLTGMGARNARRAVEQALDHCQPRHVFSCGFAGGLHPDWHAGDVLFDASEQSGLLPALNNAGAKKARFATTNRVLVTAREKHALHERTQADAVEMESEAIHMLCRERGLPCATIRAISDEACEDLPLDFNRLLDNQCQLRLSRLFVHLLRHPQCIPGLLRLQRQTRLAARRLAQVLESVLSSP